jgi:hypothetical protein
MTVEILPIGAIRRLGSGYRIEQLQGVMKKYNNNIKDLAKFARLTVLSYTVNHALNTDIQFIAT